MRTSGDTLVRSPTQVAYRVCTTRRVHMGHAHMWYSAQERDQALGAPLACPDILRASPWGTPAGHPASRIRRVTMNNEAQLRRTYEAISQRKQAQAIAKTSAQLRFSPLHDEPNCSLKEGSPTSLPAHTQGKSSPTPGKLRSHMCPVNDWSHAQSPPHTWDSSSTCMPLHACPPRALQSMSQRSRRRASRPRRTRTHDPQRACRNQGRRQTT